MAATGAYGSLLDAAGKIAIPSDGLKEAAYFESTLGGRHRVLDIGCGPGFPLVFLARCVAEICGLDASPAMLAEAERNVAALGLTNVTLIRSDARRMPFPDNHFDGFAACGSLSSISDPTAVLAEVRRTATPGALVVSLEWDFRGQSAKGLPRTERWLRRDRGVLRLEAVHYCTSPHRIRTERYTLDPVSGFVQRLSADPRWQAGSRISTMLGPEDLPAASIVDASFEEETMFDPEGLQDVFFRAGFETVDQHVADSYGVPHIFSTFRCP
jgi:ubiquinone/menaquinone biosynthesis C-methylase UbiE